ncbi:hypothetical protein BZF66_06135 [Salmonella enterica]|nr:hypothetical protein [Salmonella enterica]
MILYHASTVKIDKFYVPYGGLHVGGIHSALEAALRKVRQYDGPDVLDIYLHRVEVNTGRSMLYEDMGDDHGWRAAIICNRDNYDSIEYKNKFEPDIVNSFVLWQPERVKILSVDVMCQDEAGDIVNEFYETYNF